MPKRFSVETKPQNHIYIIVFNKIYRSKNKKMEIFVKNYLLEYILYC